MDDVIATGKSTDDLMRTVKLGYDPIEILRATFEAKIDRSVVHLSFDDFMDETTGAMREGASGPEIGALTEGEFRQLAEITIMRTNAWGHQKKAEKAIERAQARNLLLFDEISSRIDVRDGTMLDVRNATVHSAMNEDVYDRLLRNLGIK